MASTTLERLEFVPKFSQRRIWVSEEAEKVWKPRITKAANAFLAIEKLSVAIGIRKAAYTAINPIEYPKLANELNNDGLVAYPVRLEVQQTNDYSDAAQTWQPDKPFAFRVLITKPGTLDGINIEAIDDRTLGNLLGYPRCCNDFFHKNYLQEKLIDLTWPAAVTTNKNIEEGPHGARVIKIEDTPFESNILLRWAGIRTVPHMPHSFSCKESVKFGQKMLELMQDHGYAEEAEWIKEMLNWPIEWSALHGMLELRTPIFKLIARTDATPFEYKVMYMGDGKSYPDEGVKGLMFPYKVPSSKMITMTKSYNRGLEQVNSWLWKDNAFSTKEVMEAAHEPIIEVAVEAVKNVEKPRILDLGCGNGRLLMEIAKRKKDAVLIGCDLKEDAIAHARGMMPGHAERFTVKDMWDFEFSEDIDLLLMMPGRILELPMGAKDEKAKRFFEAWNNGKIKMMVSYSYSDWLKLKGGLMELTEEANIKGHFGRINTQNKIIRSDAALITHEGKEPKENKDEKTKKSAGKSTGKSTRTSGKSTGTSTRKSTSTESTAKSMKSMKSMKSTESMKSTKSTKKSTSSRKKVSEK